MIHRIVEIRPTIGVDDMVPRVDANSNFICTNTPGEAGKDGEEDNDSQINIEVFPKDLKKIDAEAGTFTYVLDEGRSTQKIIVFTRESHKTSGYDWRTI